MNEISENKVFKKNIQNLLDKSGISMRELSLAIDAAPSYIQKMMADKYDPSMDKLFSIAKYLDVPVAALFMEGNPIIQEIDTYLITLEPAQLEIVLHLTQKLAESTKQD